MKYAADLVQLHIDERIERLRGEALSRGIPVADNETLNYLLLMISATQPKRILEIGTAVGAFRRRDADAPSGNARHHH